MGSPAESFLARARGGGRERRARPRHRRGSEAPRRRPRLPRRAGVPRRGRFPGVARAGDTGRAPGRDQHRVRDRHSGRPAARLRLRSRLRLRPLARDLGGDHAPPGPAARGGVRRARSLGDRLARRPAAAGRPLPARAAGRPARDRSRGRRGALRLRRAALSPALPAAASRRRRRDRRRLRPPGGGHDRDRPRPQLARILVGVARADGDRLRPRRLRRPTRVRAPGVRAVDLHEPLPRAHARPGRPRARRCPRGAGRVTRGKRGAASQARARAATRPRCSSVPQREIRRLDELFRPYLSPQLADRLRGTRAPESSAASSGR